MKYLLFRINQSIFSIEEMLVEKIESSENLKTVRSFNKNSLKRIFFQGELFELLDPKEILGEEIKNINIIIYLKNKLAIPATKAIDFKEKEPKEVNSFFKRIIIDDGKLIPIIEEELLKRYF